MTWCSCGQRTTAHDSDQCVMCLAEWTATLDAETVAQLLAMSEGE